MAVYVTEVDKWEVIVAGERSTWEALELIISAKSRVTRIEVEIKELEEDVCRLVYRVSYDLAQSKLKDIPGGNTT